jgi:hypothetical protein
MNEFVLVSRKAEPIWSYISPFALECQYAGTLRYDEVMHFLKTAKPGHFIPLDNDNLLFRVSQT